MALFIVNFDALRLMTNLVSDLTKTKPLPVLVPVDDRNRLVLQSMTNDLNAKDCSTVLKTLGEIQ